MASTYNKAYVVALIIQIQIIIVLSVPRPSEAVDRLSTFNND